MKATSMPLPARYNTPRKASTSGDNGNNNKRSKSQSNRGRKKSSNGRVNQSLHSPGADDTGSGGDVSLLAAYKSDTQETRGLTSAHCDGNTSATSTLVTTSRNSGGGGGGGGGTSNSSAGHSLSKASLLVSLRAATLLLPLYGLHYLVIVYRPDIE